MRKWATPIAHPSSSKPRHAPALQQGDKASIKGRTFAVMVGKRKSQAESLPSASATEESDSPSPVRKRPRNGHTSSHTDGDASDEDIEAADVTPVGINGSQPTTGVQEQNGDDSDAEQEDDYEEERNEEGGEIIRRKKRVTVKLERGADGYVLHM